MKTKTKSKIIDFIRKKDGCSPQQLCAQLNISPQAVHRHLRDLCRLGIIQKRGAPPKTIYDVTQQVVVPGTLWREVEGIREVLSAHPAIALVTLFGSQARGDAGPESDIDLLVWLKSGSGFSRRDVWAYWDRQARHFPWADKVSLVVRTLSEPLCLDTLLLDLPEEHVLVFEAEPLFNLLRDAVVRWRQHWGAKKIPSFGGKHAWRYSTRVKRLSEIDFRLELKNVA